MSYIESMLNLDQKLGYEKYNIYAFLVSEGFDIGELSKAFERKIETRGETKYLICIYVYDSHIIYSVKYLEDLHEKTHRTIRYTKGNFQDFIKKYNNVIESIRAPSA